MNKFTLTAALVLIATNAFVLAGVAYNRSGEPVASLELTERELGLPYAYRHREENSGTALNLSWRVFDLVYDSDYFSYTRRTPAWLDRKKLVELGFDAALLEADAADNRGLWHRQQKEVVLVFEYQGESYRRTMEEAESRLARLTAEAAKAPTDLALAKRLEAFQREAEQLAGASRLYVIDAGTDQRALVDKYGAGGRYLFLDGRIGLLANQARVRGYVAGPLLQQVHVPLPYAEALANLEPRPNRPSTERDPEPRYSVMFNLGQRLEPWVGAVHLNHSR